MAALPVLAALSKTALRKKDYKSLLPERAIVVLGHEEGELSGTAGSHENESGQKYSDRSTAA